MTLKETTNRKKSNIYMTNLSVIAVVVMVLVTIASVFVYRALIHSTVKLDVGGNQFYTYHIAMVTESQSDPFWKNVWLAAKEEGAQKDACVEWVGSTLAEQYSLDVNKRWLLYVSSFSCAEMQPIQLALQARDDGNGASYRPRAKLRPAGQSYRATQLSII